MISPRLIPRIALLALPLLIIASAASCRARTYSFGPAEKKYLVAGKFQEVHTVGALPEPVKLANAKMEGEKHFTMANPGQPFEESDIPSYPYLPWNRLIFAGLSKDYCLVEYEHGGRAHGYAALLYRLDGGQAFLLWRAYTRDCRTMRDLRKEIGTSGVIVDFVAKPGR